MKRFFFLIGIGFLFGGQDVLAAEPLHVRFDDLPNLVRERNRHVSGSRAFLTAANQRTGYLLRSYLPSLAVSAGGETFQTGPFPQKSQPYGTVEAQWNLFRGGRDRLEEQVRQAQVRSSAAAFEQAWLEELTKARRVYWDLVYQQELLALLTEALEKNQDSLAAAGRKIKAGLATATDRLEFEMYKVQIEQDLGRATLMSANSRRMLNVLIGRPEDLLLKTEPRIPHQHNDELLKVAFDANAHRDVRATLADMEVASNQKSQAYRWWTPELDLYAGYSLYTLREREYLATADRYETVAGARLTFHLFDGLQARNEGAALAARAQGLEHQAFQTASELSAHFKAASQKLSLMHELIHSAEKSVMLGTDYLKRTQSEYVRGVKNSPDVLSAIDKYVDVRRRYAEIRRDYQMGKIELLEILGR